MNTEELNINKLLQHLTKGNKLADFKTIKKVTKLDEIQTGDTILKIKNNFLGDYDRFEIMTGIKVLDDRYPRGIRVSNYQGEDIYYNTKKEAFDTDGIHSGTIEGIPLQDVEKGFYFKFLKE